MEKNCVIFVFRSYVLLIFWISFGIGHLEIFRTMVSFGLWSHLDWVFKNAGLVWIIKYESPFFYVPCETQVECTEPDEMWCGVERKRIIMTILVVAYSTVLP